ncbi:MAG: hypothetical protein AAGN35_12945 [Bacteroidota bacterium]
MQNPDPKKHAQWILLAGAVLFGFYLLGMAFPEPFWGTNNPGFLPLPVQLAVLLLAAGCFVGPRFLKPGSLPALPAGLDPRWWAFGLGILGAVLFYSFPIALDRYGDSVFIRQDIDLTIEDWDGRLISELLQPDWLSSKVGLRSWYQLNNLFSWLLGMNGVEVARLLGAVYGGIFIGLWVRFCHLFLRETGWRRLFITVGLTAPFLQVFAGHYETYSIAYVGILGWVSALGLYFQTGSRRWLFALPFIFLVILQTHITNWLLFPTLAMAYAWHYREKLATSWGKIDAALARVLPGFRGGWSWSGLLVYYFLPALSIGAYAYFVVFANHDGPRQFSKEEFENTLFLPLYTGEPAPLDRYNLFSAAHFLDYLNLMFLWSSAALLLFVPPLTFLRRKIDWRAPLVLMLSATLVLYLIVFFALNPLLAASVDWDLFVLPGLVALSFLVVVYAQVEREMAVRHAAGPVLGLVVLGMTFFLVNASPASLSDRYAAMGRWNYKTYWIGSSTVLLTPAELATDSVSAQAERVHALEDLAPYATPGNDREYAGLLLEVGLHHRRTGNPAAAIPYLERAHSYSPRLGRNLYFLTVTHFEMKQFRAAYPYVRDLVRIKYPPYERTLKIGMHVALAAQEYQSAADYAVTYLNRWQDDPVVVEVERRLRTGDRIATIVDLFGQ